jgi:hypothetical protein
MIDDLARKNQLARISADLARKSVVSAKKKIPAAIYSIDYANHISARHFYEYFSCTVEPSLVQEWKQDGAVQIIGPAELYPVWLARQRWGARLRGRRVILCG